jgi:membrane associated rhomboid family serine protease
MFLVVPYGHDQTVYGRQWITLFLIAFNFLAFGASFVAERYARDHFIDAAAEVDVLHEIYPDARVPPSAVAAAPPIMRDSLEFLVSDDPDDLGEQGAYPLKKAVTRMIAAANEQPTLRFGYIPARPTVLGFLGSPFMHADIWHIAGNMLFLWLAGAVIECFWERIPFALLYFAAGAAGLVAHHLAGPDSVRPMVGASGAIAGLLGAFVVGHPKTKIKLFYAFWLIRPFIGTRGVSAWILIPGWFLLQIGYALFGGDGGVAYWAHVGGFLCGILGALIMRWGGWAVFDGANLPGERAAAAGKNAKSPRLPA